MYHLPHLLSIRSDIVLKKGLMTGVKRKDAQSDVIVYLAEKGPANMYQIGKQTCLYYSSVHKVINTFLLSGVVQPGSNAVSEKNVQTISYGLTFKGVLKYLSTFTIPPILLTKVTKEDVAERNRKFDEAYEKDLLNVLEKQGQILDYAPFQECRWLSGQHAGLIRLFISLAQLHLDPLFFNVSEFGDKFSKNLLSDPEFPFGTDDLRDLRNVENLDFKYAFGKAFLQNMVGNIKKNSKNEKLRLFAERIIAENKTEIALLEKAASSF